MEEEKRKPNANDHLANERTFLAWVRTSVGIMALGFVVVKFSLFVKQLSLVVGKEYDQHPHGYSGAIGIFLVAAGAVTSGLAYVGYRRTEKQLREGKYQHSSLLITLLTCFIFVVSLLVIVYLIQST
jgi:putative membrane protein